MKLSLPTIGLSLYIIFVAGMLWATNGFYYSGFEQSRLAQLPNSITSLLITSSPQIFLLVILYKTKRSRLQEVALAALVLSAVYLMMEAFFNVSHYTEMFKDQKFPTPEDKTRMIEISSKSALSVVAMSQLVLLFFASLLYRISRRLRTPTLQKDEATDIKLDTAVKTKWYLPKSSDDKCSLAIATLYALLMAAMQIRVSGGFGNLLTTTLVSLMFFLWVCGPQLALLNSVLKSKIKTTKQAYIFIQVILAGLSLLIYYNGFFVNTDAQSGLLFIWIPIWQYLLLIGIAVMGVIYRLTKKAFVPKND